MTSQDSAFARGLSIKKAESYYGVKKMILTSKRRVEQQFAGGNTQHTTVVNLTNIFILNLHFHRANF